MKQQLAYGSMRADELPNGEIGIQARVAGTRTNKHATVILTRGQVRALAEWLVKQPENGPTKVAVQPADDLNLEPLGSCNRCGRKYWKRETTGTFDGMVQPNGGICGGRFELNGGAGK